MIHDDLKYKFLQSLTQEDITDADYAQTKMICKDFEIKFKRIS